MTWHRYVITEHIGYRRRSGWTWGQIMAEASDCLLASGQQLAGGMPTVEAIERAYERAYDALQRESVGIAA